MPSYKGHMIGGLVSYAGVLYLLRCHNPTVFTAAEWLFFTLIGALFPDIDTKSKGQKFFYQLVGILLFVLLLQKRFQAVAFVAIIALFPLLVRHRGITHSLYFIVGLSLLIVAFAHFVAPCYATIVFFDTLFFFVGACSHILLDRVITRIWRNNG
jgi:membrane-bound metal-dependent hydrolase YbcI (DUF457 family)